MGLFTEFVKQAMEQEGAPMPGEVHQSPEGGIPVETGQGLIELTPEELVEAIDAAVNAGELTEEDAIALIEEVEDRLRQHFLEMAHPGGGQEIPENLTPKMAEELDKFASELMGDTYIVINPAKQTITVV